MKILPCGVAVIEGDECHAKWIAELGTIHHDPWFRDQILKHIKPGDVVVQGGANIGTLTRAMLDAGAKVYAFEPNEQAIQCLRHNCREYTFEGIHRPEGGLESFLEAMGEPLKIMPFALGKAGMVEMVIQENAGASFCVKRNVALYGTKNAIREVSLDKEIEGRLSPNMILLDIEGYEHRALSGAAQTIAQCRPVIICEVNRGALLRAGTSDAELLGLIEDMGYSIEIMQPECRIGDPQFDILCLPK